MAEEERDLILDPMCPRDEMVSEHKHQHKKMKSEMSLQAAEHSVLSPEPLMATTSPAPITESSGPAPRRIPGPSSFLAPFLSLPLASFGFPNKVFLGPDGGFTISLGSTHL